MYFKSRVEAGRELAKQIVGRYRGQQNAVVALNDGGVVVGSQIALELDCVLMLLLNEAVELPREDSAVGGITQDGSFSYNKRYSEGEIQEMVSENYNYIEQEKMTKMQEMHRTEGGSRLIRKALLKDRNIILVTDGLFDGFALDVAAQYLKPIHIGKLVVATPMASVPSVDRMHVTADDIYCLNVLEDYIGTDHYYDINDVPPHAKVVRIVENIVTGWR
jgi:predicted phosphoribosyltransferase